MDHWREYSLLFLELINTAVEHYQLRRAVSYVLCEHADLLSLRRLRKIRGQNASLNKQTYIYKPHILRQSEACSLFTLKEMKAHCQALSRVSFLPQEVQVNDALCWRSADFHIQQ